MCVGLFNQQQFPKNHFDNQNINMKSTKNHILHDFETNKNVSDDNNNRSVNFEIFNSNRKSRAKLIFIEIY